MSRATYMRPQAVTKRRQNTDAKASSGRIRDPRPHSTPLVAHRNGRPQRPRGSGLGRRGRRCRPPYNAQCRLHDRPFSSAAATRCNTHRSALACSSRPYAAIQDDVLRACQPARIKLQTCRRRKQRWRRHPTHIRGILVVPPKTVPLAGMLTPCARARQGLSLKRLAQKVG